MNSIDSSVRQSPWRSDRLLTLRPISAYERRYADRGEMVYPPKDVADQRKGREYLD